MKNVCLVTGSDLRMVMGVNYYIKSFILCNEFFKTIRVNRVYSGSQILKVDEGEVIPIGSDIGTAEYKFRRGIRSFFRKLLTYKFYPFEKFRYELNLYRVSKKSIRHFIEDTAPCDYLIFEERGVAEYFFKHCNRIPKTTKIKTFLVVHSEGDARLSLPLRHGKTINERIKKDLYKRRDYVYSHVDRVIYISQKAYNSSILPPEKRSYVYNGAPFVKYDFSLPINMVKQFVCVGNLSGGKGQEKILEALSLLNSPKLRKMHMTFVGGGSNLEELKNMTQQLGIKDSVSFLGVRNDVPEILKGMDVFIMPSLTEGLSMSAIEAMRAGLFLVLTDTGGNKELCEDGCGVICTREPENIKKIIEEILDGEIICKEQKEHSHKRYVSLYSTESMAKGYEEVLLST